MTAGRARSNMLVLSSRCTEHERGCRQHINEVKAMSCRGTSAPGLRWVSTSRRRYQSLESVHAANWAQVAIPSSPAVETWEQCANCECLFSTRSAAKATSDKQSQAMARALAETAYCRAESTSNDLKNQDSKPSSFIELGTDDDTSGSTKL